MLLSGFTFIRNAKKYDFPIRECIESMLPIVDELVVNIGNSEDDTEELIASIGSPKIKVIRSVWDDTKTESGLVLSEQTNIALDHCQGRWALYLQADEALHENEVSLIRAAVEEADRNGSDIDGFKFRYLHFYSGYSLIQRPWNWYPSEIRIVKRASALRSFGDAQTFRFADEGRKPRTPLLDAHVFHYGHARHPDMMAQKIRYFHRFWHGDDHGIKVNQAYQLERKNLVWYWSTHPKAYTSRVEQGSEWSPKPSQVVGRGFDRIAIFTDKNHLELGRELLALLGSHARDKTHIELVCGIRAWMKFYFRGSFRRERSAVIDLTAESRSLLSFLSWICDAVIAYGWRVAHAPQGTLSQFRSRFYSAVNWGAHEKMAEGFQVPKRAYAGQLVRWLGFEP